MAKDKKCSFLTLDDTGTIFFWGLILVLFILVVTNLILTAMVLSIFKIGFGMDAIKLVPEMKAIKFNGIIDFARIYKKDGRIETFRDSPLLIEGDDNFIKLDLLDRRGLVSNRFSMGSNGTNVYNINQINIKDPETNLPIFSSSKRKYNLKKKMKNLKTKAVYASELTSPINENLKLEALNLFVRGIEGTQMDGKEILFSASENVYLKSSNGSLRLESGDGIYIDLYRIPIAEPIKNHLSTSVRNDLQFKLCVCYPKGVLYRVQMSKMHNVEDVCSYFDRRYFNPCA